MDESKNPELNDPYALDPEFITTPPKNLLQMARYWGPGLILTASVVGSGELIATTGLGAKAGFIALWVILLSCFLKIALQLMIGRYAIYTGQTTLQFFNQLPGPKAKAGWFVWLLFVVLVFVTLNQGAMLGGIGMVLNILVPQLSVTVWAFIVTSVVIVLLRMGRYEHIERLSILMVTAFSLATIICVSMIQTTPYQFTAGNIISGLKFDLPQGGLSIAFALIGITGIGATEIIFYPYWCIEKGYARSVGPYKDTPQWYHHARGWIRTMDWDACLSMLIYTVLTIAFFILGAAVLHTQRLIPEGMAMIETLSHMYTQILGNWAFLLFLTGAFFALFSTIFVSIAANARLFVECFELAGIFHVDNFQQRSVWISIFVTILSVIMLILFLIFKLPLWMVVVGGTAQALLLPAIVFGIIYIRFWKFDVQLKPSLLFDGFFLLSCLVIIVFSIYALIHQLT